MNVIIRKLSNFARLSSDDVVMLEHVTSQRQRHLAAREDIIVEGEKPEVINVILTGWACRYKLLEDGRRQIIAFFLPGDMCDLNVFILKQMDRSIGAITPVLLAEVTRAGFEELMLTHPRVTQALWWESLVTAAIQREWTVNLGQRNAYERMAHLFCELYLRLNITGSVDGHSYTLPLTQAELGEVVGLSAVHVKRTLQELRADNLIELKGKTVVIRDIGRLRDVALFNSNYLHLDHDGRHLDANT